MDEEWRAREVKGIAEKMRRPAIQEDFLSDTDLDSLKEELKTIPLHLNSNDMMRFHQSENLAENLSNYPAVENFVDILKDNVRPALEDFYQRKTHPDKLTLTVSRYDKGDYLLCHDDRSSTRTIAFIFYLNTLEKADGGQLKFFRIDKIGDQPQVGEYSEEISPCENTLVTFPVSEVSFHEVEQMYSDKSRLSLNGWFHNESLDDDLEVLPPYFSRSSMINLQMAIFPIMGKFDILAEPVFGDRYLDSLKEEFYNSGGGLLIKDALNERFYANCEMELQLTCIEDNWETQGPANFRNYQVFPYEVKGPHICFAEELFHIGNLVDMLMSDTFLKILSLITGVTFAIFDCRYLPPTAMIEFQRWREGSYSLLCDNDLEREQETLDVTVFFAIRQDLLNEENGMVVRAIKQPKLKKRDEKYLMQAKLKRILSSIRRGDQKNNKGVLSSNKIALVAKKIAKVQKYRETRNEEVAQYDVSNGNMLISIGNKNCAKYVPYIRKKDASSNDIAFIAISATYCTTSS